MGTPKNFNGEQASQFGKGYAGLYLFAPEDYREYLQGELTEPLQQGKQYQISFYVSLAERSDFAIKEFGVLFAKNPLDIPTKKELSKRHWYGQKGNAYNYLEIGYTNFYSDTREWIHVSTRFTAKGTERFLILGNFANNARTRKFETKRNAKQGAYYYVDRVTVEAADALDNTWERNPDTKDGLSEGSPDSPQTVFTIDQIHVFKNVLFEFDHFAIVDAAQAELRRIHDYLVAHPSLHIAIHGHTDSLGSESYNQRLSRHRARAVADFLIKLGVPHNRIVWKGHGGRQPVASNTTEAGRSRNRRVEFVISNPNTQ